MRFVLGIMLVSSLLLSQQVPGTNSTDAFAGRMTLETVVPDEAVFVGQFVRVTVRAGIDRELLRERLVQPYARVLDLPVHLEATWLSADGPLGARPASASLRHDGLPRVTRTVAVNNGITTLTEAEDVTRGGVRMAMFELSKFVVPRTVGDVELEPVTLKFASAERFSTDFLGNRVPEGRIDGAMRGEAASITVMPLPVAGRPSGFSGLIGRYAVVTAIAEPSERDPHAITVKATLVGDGNVETIRQLRAEPIPGFRVQGLLDAGGGSPRSLTLELVAVGRVPHEIPPLKIAVFDPTPPGSYRFIESPVMAIPGRTSPPGEAGLPLRDARALDWTDQTGILWRGALLLPWIALLLLWTWLSERDRDRADPGGARARRAFKALRVASRQSGSPHDAMGVYLAARTRSQLPGIVDRNLAERLVSIGVNETTAEAVATRWLEGIDARYGSRPADMTWSEVLSMATAIETVVARRRGSP